MMKSMARLIIPKPIRQSLSRLLGFGMPYFRPLFVMGRGAGTHIRLRQRGILERVRGTSLKVVKGEFAYEQDSVRSRRPQLKQLLLALAASAAGRANRGLNIVDFGGSLGSLFFRARPFLDSTPIARWIVCEQAHFVALGNAEFHRPPLEFAIDPMAAAGDEPVDLLILSGVLPYLQDPLGTLQNLMALSPRWILIDRTPMSPDDRTYLLIQHTPRSIYKATYPIWLLAESAIHSLLGQRYSIQQEFEVAEGPVVLGPLTRPYRGILLRLKCDNALGRDSSAVPATSPF